jgi:hypothetical protein
MSAVEIPSTPAGDNFATWLEAFNTNIEIALREYHLKNFPHQNSSEREKNVANELNLRSTTGGFDVQQIITSEPTKLSVVVQQRSNGEEWGKITVEVTPMEVRYVLVFQIQKKEEQLE